MYFNFCISDNIVEGNLERRKKVLRWAVRMNMVSVSADRRGKDRLAGRSVNWLRSKGNPSQSNPN